MNGVHDMGGMHGFGHVAREENEPVFHAPWEGRMFGIAIATAGPVPVFRFAIEKIDPARYLSSSYYARWLLAKERMLMDEGLLTAEELDARTEFFRQHPRARVPRREDPGATARVLKAVRTRASPHREVGVAPQFHVGNPVRARNINPPGHTRLPRYVRGKRGVVARVYGVHAFDDSIAGGGGADPQALYSVRFDARELWGSSAEAHVSVHLDMWESYLEPS